MLSTKFQFILENGFRGEDFLEINQSETRMESSFLKLHSQMNQNLVGCTYGRFCIKFPQSRMKGERHRLRLSGLSL
jgi:hypothetical protein